MTTLVTKTDDDTERQLVHTLTHAIVFIVSICLCRTSGAQYICPLSSRTAQRTIAGPAQAVTDAVPDAGATAGAQAMIMIMPWWYNVEVVRPAQRYTERSSS